MRKFSKRALALTLSSAMVLSLAACNKGQENTDATTAAATTVANGETTAAADNNAVTTGDREFVYKDSVSVLASNWNPHTYVTTDDSYPAEFIRDGLYSFIFNDELNPVEGKEPFAGYKIIPEMAASMPVDVTEQVKKDHPEFNIPADATEGYAYTIDLNPLATWENGEKINADTYVYSMKQLLDPELKNYRASDYMDSEFVVANAKNYYYQGTTNYMDNGITNGYSLADLTLDADGNYVTPDGDKMYIGLDFPLEWTGGDTLNYYVSEYGDGYFDVTNWEELIGMVDENGLVPLNDATYELFVPVTTGNPAWGETEDDVFNYLVQAHEFEAGYDFANVGLYKTGDYQITLVLGKSLAGFTLLYNLSSNWIVYEPYYEAGKTKIGDTDAWASTYNTDVESTMSYGPYKLVSFQSDKSMRFEKNENWFGYSDGIHIYKDPEDGEIYPMYQTTAIDCQVVAEAATNKLMFLKGQLMKYGLQSEDFAEYRDSDFCYVTPDETIYFFIFNGYMDAIKSREAAEDFDQSKFDLETLTLQSFRKAVAVTYDKEALCTAVSPARSGGYGLIGNNYIYDPDTGAKYRDSDQAKRALCEFYSVDISKYASLDDAVDSITGYDEVAAKTLYTEAFNEAMEAGYITDLDGDGVSDQTIEIIYASAQTSSFIQKTLDYLTEKMAEVTAGTPFDGKIVFKESAPLGNDWSNTLKSGLADTVLAGWSGSALNPFSLSDLYVNPSKQYDAKWFDASSVSFTLNVNTSSIKSGATTMEDVTMTLKQWSDALNGATVEIDGKSYNFGDGIADVDTRLEILSKIETAVLMTYDYIPMLQNAGMSLLSQQVYYVVEDYSVIMGRGGIAYMKYNYDEEEWANYVKEQGGELSY